MIPTSVAPITFFARDDSEWMLTRHGGVPGEAMQGLGATFQRRFGVSPIARSIVLQRYHAGHAANYSRKWRAHSGNWLPQE